MQTKHNLLLPSMLCAALLHTVSSRGQPVTLFDAGGFHTLIVRSDGSLWGMGGNYDGELGDGTFSFNSPYGTNRPERIVAGGVMAIAAGRHHSLFIKSDGSLWAMGYDYEGQLGDGVYGFTAPYGTNVPELIVASNVTAIAAGDFHSLFLKSDGSVWAMGHNFYGELGDGTFGGLVGTNNVGTNRPEQIVTGGVTAIAAGGAHSLFVKSDGSLWAMGYNFDGQLGDGTSNIRSYQPEQIVASGVTTVAAGEYYSLFMKSDGSLWGMGENDQGQLGDGTNSNTNRPKLVLAGPPTGYNRIVGQLLGDGSLRLSFVGNAGANYALDRTFTLAPPNWMPQVTNAADASGGVVFTNNPNTAANNFWRVRSVP